MPDWRKEVRASLPDLAVGPQRESEIVAELATQMEQAYAAALAGGASEEEAVRQARNQFADWRSLAREIDVAERPPRSRVLAGAWQDLSYATRMFARNRAFAAIAIATLACGIGANTAIFTMVDAVALRGLPYRAPQQLMAIETRKANQPELEPWTSALDFFDILERTRAFSGVAAISPVWNVVMTGRGDAQQLDCLYVSADFFPMLGVSATLGRTFLPEEDRRTQAGNVVVLSHSWWQRQFAGDREMIGKTLVLGGSNFTVIGVLPESFRYAGEPLAGTATEIDAWLPLGGNQLAGSARTVRFLKVIGRLKPGVSAAQGSDEMRRIGAALAEQYPATNRGFTGGAEPLAGQVTGRFHGAMLLLLGTVGFVLLMTCANVANLLLTRASARQREVSVRVALGASRARLMRQMLMESLVLAGAGGLAGLAVGSVGLRMLLSAAPSTLIHPGSISLDGRALLFTTAVALACALLAGLPPAWRAAGADVEAGLRESARGLTAGNHRLRSSLVVAQVSAALLLLMGAGLLIRSFQRLLAVDPGFRAQNLLTISTLLPPGVTTPEQRAAMLRAIRGRLAEVPGVESVASVSRLPLMGSNLGSWLFPEGKFVPGEPGRDVEYRVATPNYFAAMGIPLRAGRMFDEHDDANAGAVLVINETAARTMWPGENAVGKRVRLGTSADSAPWITVVGVVGDVRHVGIDTEPRPEVYRPYAYNPLGAPILVVRTGTDPGAMASLLSARVRSVNAGLPAYNVYRMEDLVERSTAQRRFVMLLLTGFAMAALLLAGVGIYGTVSQAVAQRTQEIGLRMALGASPGGALWLVFRDGARLTGTGIAAGAAAALGMTRVMERLLFEVRPLDPAAFGGAAVTLAVFAALACYVPARRATRVDPLEALRQEG